MAAKSKPPIPSVPVGDRATQHFLNSVKESIEVGSGQRGDKLDRWITVRELIESGVVRLLTYSDIFDTGHYYDIAPIFTDDDNLTVPPAPTNLTAEGAFTSITLIWDKPSYSNHSKTFIYRLERAEGAPVPNIGDAIAAGSINSSIGHIYNDVVGYDKHMYYWIQFESTAGIRGPFNATAGTDFHTLADIGATMEALSEDLSNLEGYQTLTQTTVPSLIAANTTKIIKSDSAPTAREDNSALQPQDIWIDTNDEDQMYVRNVVNQPTNGTAVNTQWVKVRDGTLVNLVDDHTDVIGNTSYTGTSLTAAMYSAQTDVSAQAGRIENLEVDIVTKTQTFAEPNNLPTSPESVVIGDLWIDTGNENKIYRAASAGSNEIKTGEWEEITSDSTKTFADNTEPASGVSSEGDLWIDLDSDPANKLYRYDGNNWISIDNASVQASADYIDDVIIAVGLSGATSTKIEALQASAGLLFGARVITAQDSNTVKVETMTNADNSTTTTAHGITADDVTAGVFLSLKGIPETGVSGESGLSTIQLNKTHKVTARVNATQLQIETVGEAAGTGATSVTQEDGVTIGASAGIAQLASTQADVEGNSHAAWVLQVNANGSVGGMVIEAYADAAGDNTGTAIQFDATKFAIWNSQTNVAVAPFIVAGDPSNIVNGQEVQTVFIDTARIKDGAIQSAKIESLNADLITSGTINAANIDITNIDAANITTGLLSADYITAGTINATISMSSPVITGGIITGTAITTDTLVVHNAAGSNTIGKVDVEIGANTDVTNQSYPYTSFYSSSPYYYHTTYDWENIPTINYLPQIGSYMTFIPVTTGTYVLETLSTPYGTFTSGDFAFIAFAIFKVADNSSTVIPYNTPTTDSSFFSNGVSNAGSGTAASHPKHIWGELTFTTGYKYYIYLYGYMYGVATLNGNMGFAKPMIKVTGFYK